MLIVYTLTRSFNCRPQSDNYSHIQELCIFKFVTLLSCSRATDSARKVPLDKYVG